MWSLAFVALLATATRGDSWDIFDVTTIYDVGRLCKSQGMSTSVKDSTMGRPGEESCVSDLTGRIHSRTNSLGLPVYSLQNFNIKYPENYQLPNITCVGENCYWDVKQWTSEYYSFEMRRGKAYSITRAAKIVLETMDYYTSINSGLYLIFTPDPSLIRDINGKISMILFSKNMYQYTATLLFFENCSGPKTHKYSYSNYIYTVPDYDGAKVTIGCETYLTHSMSTSNELKLEINDGSVQLYIDGSLLMTSQNIKFFSTVGEIPESYSPSLKYQSKEEGIEMVSPTSIGEVSQLCIVLILHSPIEISGDLLHILAVDQTNTKHFLQAVNKIKAGWNVKHIKFKLQNDILHPVKLAIQKKGLTEVKINYIASCNPEGQEVGVIPPKYVPYYELQTVIPKLPVYTVDTLLIPLMNVTKVPDETNQCFNGGELTTAGCACLPGFSGAQCQLACGKNRFGQDCEGLCSFHSHACEGLLMCTNFTGCHCGSGYKGNGCTEQCLPGWYGNDCLLQCGHCASGTTCDIFTGRCTSCDRGYVPPYCQKEYVYYAIKPEVESTSYGSLTVKFYLKNVTGHGTPKLYQVQYREKDIDWITYKSKIIPSYNMNHESSGEGLDPILETVDGLKDGVRYQVRVLFLVASFNKYDGNLVQISETVTKCDIPDEYDYNVTTARNTTSLTFMWNYVNNTVHWCPVETYEVSWEEGWFWQTEQSQEGFTLTNLMAGLPIQFKVRAKTSKGYAPYSTTVRISTLYNELSAVEDLHLVSAQSTSVEVAWRPPIGSNNRDILYRITCKCVEQPACPPGCVNASEGELTQNETRLIINHLLPFTQYKVSVAPEDGQETAIHVGTTEVVPIEKPRLSAQPVMRTNTSLTVFWVEVPVCTSFLLGYNYQLVKESESLKVLASGFTKNTDVSFKNLTASTDYIVKVFIFADAGWNAESFLVINASTSATVPEAVCNLTIYKKGRSMLGLRWAKPKATYGKLKSFTIRHTTGQDIVSHTIEPKPCTVWPDLYCHTVEALKFNRVYNITVSARNVDVAEDGVEASVTALTKENIPTAPEKLIWNNRSSTTVGLQWNYPNFANGIIRSFFISVEETDKYDLENCCQVYPLIETPVTDEMEHYEAEVTGLQPASTYYVAVSAKTVGLGPSQPLVVYTRPPHLPLNVLPSPNTLSEVIVPLFKEISWLPQDMQPEVNNSELYTPLIKAHLLFGMINESQALVEELHSGILDEELDLLLQEFIHKPFFFIAEYTQDEFITQSVWGQVMSPSLFVFNETYQLVAAQVTNYSGAMNVDLRYSTTFTL